MPQPNHATDSPLWFPRGPWLLVTQHRNSRMCRNDAERVEMVWRSSSCGVHPCAPRRGCRCGLAVNIGVLPSARSGQVNPGSRTAQYGQTGAFFLNYICSSYNTALFWGLNTPAQAK